MNADGRGSIENMCSSASICGSKFDRISVSPCLRVENFGCSYFHSLEGKLGREVAGGPAAVDLEEGRVLLGADRLGVAAAGVEVTAGGGVRGAGHIALEADPLAAALRPRI